ncbi:PREDICTED: peroxidasin homolog [Branchiostoma belcheri]|uniref:Peroxidasin homolog n=1 Tax=Branchiostoma belcheri TaxID=7741 RepID=A0A6P4ZW28_BRABE|nr:PREDICTED: peroxidasin homolog [Branchiostoma belcheri]
MCQRLLLILVGLVAIATWRASAQVSEQQLAAAVARATQAVDRAIQEEEDSFVAASDDDARISPAGRLLAMFRKSKPEARPIARSAEIMEDVTSQLTRTGQTDADFSAASDSPSTRRVCQNTELRDLTCPQPDPAIREFRTIDGRCNNLDNPLWGAAIQPMKRLLRPLYADSVQSPRVRGRGGAALPSAREVSFTLHEDMRTTSTVNTHLVMQWGQFLDHDITHTPVASAYGGGLLACPCGSTDRRCFNIPIPAGDPDFSGHSCMEFVRSSPAPNPGCRVGRRQQLDQITAFIDASMVYGSSEEELEHLRDPSLERGQLKSKANPGDSRKKELLPSAITEEFHCPESSNPSSRNQPCFQAGDVRVNEQPALTSMHTVWLREHNRIADRLHDINSHWDEDRVFYETRKIIGAAIQQITYAEDLPIVLGLNAMNEYGLVLRQNGYYSGYDETVDPTISNVFATAAYRFGHSLVESEFVRSTSGYNHNAHPPVQLTHSFFNPQHVYNNVRGGLDSIVRGLASTPHEKFDRFIVSGLTKNLFADPAGSLGLDLAALNIQRGRDHGLPGYNDWRVLCGLPRARSFADLATEIPDASTRAKLADLYNHVDDIDVFAAGLAERSVPGGLLGPTFACLVGRQFRELRKGDRFWFENQGQFSQRQLAEIRKVTLARVLCDNTDDTTTMQPHVFELPGPGNRRVSCFSIPQPDLNAWRESSTVVGQVRDFFTDYFGGLRG